MKIWASIQHSSPRRTWRMNRAWHCRIFDSQSFAIEPPEVTAYCDLRKRRWGRKMSGILVENSADLPRPLPGTG